MLFFELVARLKKIEQSSEATGSWLQGELMKFGDQLKRHQIKVQNYFSFWSLDCTVLQPSLHVIFSNMFAAPSFESFLRKEEEQWRLSCETSAVASTHGSDFPHSLRTEEISLVFSFGFREIT